MRPALQRLFLALPLTVLPACGSTPPSPDDLGGTWQVDLKHETASLDLVEKDNADLAGTFSLGDALWSVTGTVNARPAFSFYIAPVQNELLLFDAVGLTPVDTANKRLLAAHAADKLTFRAVIDDTGTRADGVVSAALSAGESSFSMRR